MIEIKTKSFILNLFVFFWGIYFGEREHGRGPDRQIKQVKGTSTEDVGKAVGYAKIQNAVGGLKDALKGK